MESTQNNITYTRIQKHIFIILHIIEEQIEYIKDNTMNNKR